MEFGLALGSGEKKKEVRKDPHTCGLTGFGNALGAFLSFLRNDKFGLSVINF